MATPIIVNPAKPSQVVVNGTQKSGTPITINTDLDYTRVQSMIGEALGDVNIDLTPIENKVDEGVSTLSDKIDNIKLPDIDTTEFAKQGENPEATNTAIFNAVNTFLSRSVKYDKTTGNLTIENVELIIE